MWDELSPIDSGREAGCSRNRQYRPHTAVLRRDDLGDTHDVRICTYGDRYSTPFGETTGRSGLLPWPPGAATGPHSWSTLTRLAACEIAARASYTT